MSAWASSLAAFGNEHHGFGCEEEEALWERWEGPDSVFCDAATQVALLHMDLDLDFILMFLLSGTKCEWKYWRCEETLAGWSTDHKLAKIWSLLPWFVQKLMSHFQHYCVHWDGIFVSTNHMKVILMLSSETLICGFPCFCLNCCLLLCGETNLQPVDGMNLFQCTHFYERENPYTV